MLRSTWRAVALATTVPLLAAAFVSTPALAAEPVTKVTLDDIGTVNYGGGGAWSTTVPGGQPWDLASAETLFAEKPTDGGRWTLDNEGKINGTTTMTNAGIQLTVLGVPSTGDYAISQKVRYSYFLGSGGYPQLDDQLTDGVETLDDFLSSDFSYTGSYAESLTDSTVGTPTLDLRIQSLTAPYQRVSLHSNGDGATTLGPVVSTIVGSDPAHAWKINSTANGHSVQTSFPVSTLLDDFGNWEVVSFGFNVGRGAEGVATVSSLSAMGEIFAFGSATLPSIAGTASVGSKLTAVAGDFAADNALSYAWKSGATVVGTASSYTPTATDVGASLTLAVTGTRTGKTITRQSSAVTVARGTIALHSAPTISGTPKAGSKLSSATGAWDAGVTFGYQWLRGTTPITGATESSYTPSAADVKSSIAVRVTGTKPGYTSVTATSAGTGAVAAVTVLVSALVKTPIPKVSGTAKVGKSLKAKAGTWSKGVKLTYQWYRDGVKIPKATKATYKIGAADKGKRIWVKVTGKKTGYKTVTKVSGKSGKIK